MATYPQQQRPARRAPVWGVVLAVLIAAAGAVAVYLMGRDADPPAPAAPPTTQAPAAPSPTPPDPYEVYLEIAPEDAVELSREDAQMRALLGCGQAWAPGTVDAALAEAYRHLCPAD